MKGVTALMISSLASEYQSACIASHRALIGLNKALSIEGVSFGITSNIICPGILCSSELTFYLIFFNIGHTQINTFEQFDQIKTLADLILYLCSDQTRLISGQSIPWSSI
jgi:NAD(P)-dependent dehydrogenase (short-subunit alcohol dehydrogenase family)